MTVKNAALPVPYEAMYKLPNPDGTRQRCGRCVAWVSGENKCLIHPKDLTVREHFWCGYFIFGQPNEKWVDHPGGRAPVDPAYSGLRLAGGGLACDTCVYYEAKQADSGDCYAVAKESDKKPPQPVAALASCARHSAE